MYGDLTSISMEREVVSERPSAQENKKHEKRQYISTNNRYHKNNNIIIKSENRHVSFKI